MAVLKRRNTARALAPPSGTSEVRMVSPSRRTRVGLAMASYLLSGWAFLEVLEYFGTLSLLVAAVSYFGESKDRIKQKHYQASRLGWYASQQGGPAQHGFARRQMARNRGDKTGVSHTSNRFAQAGSFGYICDSLQEVHEARPKNTQVPSNAGLRPRRLNRPRNPPVSPEKETGNGNKLEKLLVQSGK